MSSQIDPVTNLPIFVPPPLEQIPFKNPPYPWNDLTDNPVTPRTTYYGDDSIPTVATIAGMHPIELGAQTVNTDGNHALLVKSVGGSSGANTGISSIFQSNVLHRWNGSNAGLEIVLQHWNFTIRAPYVFGVSWYLVYVVGASEPNTDSYIQLLGDSGSDSARIVNLWGESHAGSSDLPVGTVITIQDSLMFPQPIHAASAWPNSTEVRIIGNCGRATFMGSGSIYGGEFG